MTDLTLCSIHTNFWRGSYYRSPKRIEERRLHEGPCLIGLYLQNAGLGPEWDCAWAAKRAIEFSEFYTEDSELLDAIEVANELLTRPKVDKYYIEVTPEEREKLVLVLREAQDYWVLNNYAHTEGTEEDQALGHFADSGLITAIASACWRQPVTIERTDQEVQR